MALQILQNNGCHALLQLTARATGSREMGHFCPELGLIDKTASHFFCAALRCKL